MLSALSVSMAAHEQAACSVYVSIQWARAACLLDVCIQAAAQIQAMEVEQEGLRKELEIAEEDKDALQQRLLGSEIVAPRYAHRSPGDLALDRLAWVVLPCLGGRSDPRERLQQAGGRAPQPCRPAACLGPPS